MGSYFSRNGSEVEEIDISPHSTYIYPPKSGNFFSSHFVMGGEKFETMQPESYLFGENADLNFLGPKPFDAPYRIASQGQPLKALRCLVNIRKDSLRLVKIPRLMGKPAQKVNDSEPTYAEIPSDEGSFMYNVEFVFDADCPCSITIYYNATEDIVNKNVIYAPEKHTNVSDTVHFTAGSKQQFCLPSHCINPEDLCKHNVDWTKGYTKIPIVIQICADAGPTVVGHSHITYAEFYKPSVTSWSLRAVKQKQAIDGVCYLIQEIFGIENKNSNEDEDDEDSDAEDDSSDCVVCLSELRDTMILPCRHLCLCSTCADQLRYQQSGCPICRQSFRALLRIRAVRPINTSQGTTTQPRRNSSDSEGEADTVPVPPGYEVVPLIEAIKGQATAVQRDASEVSAPTPSTSRDEVSIVDETSKSTIGVEEITIVTDDSDYDDTVESQQVNVLFHKTDRPANIDIGKVENENDFDLQSVENEYEEISLPAGTPDDISPPTGKANANVKEFAKKTNKDESLQQNVPREEILPIPDDAGDRKAVEV